MLMLGPPLRVQIRFLSGWLAVGGEKFFVILVWNGMVAGTFCSAYGHMVVFDCLKMKRCSEHRSL